MMQELFRPWAGQGLEHLLVTENGLDQASSASHLSPNTHSVKDQRALSDSHPAPTCPPPTSNHATSPQRPLDSAKWPDCWKSTFDRISPQTRVLLTYQALGTDLMGKASPLRRQFFGKLISKLRWPKGTVGFWPFTFNSEPVSPTAEEQDVFLTGLYAIRPEALFFFGASFQLETGLQVETPETRPSLGSIPIFKLHELHQNHMEQPGFLDAIATRMTALFSPF